MDDYARASLQSFCCSARLHHCKSSLWSFYYGILWNTSPWSQSAIHYSCWWFNHCWAVCSFDCGTQFIFPSSELCISRANDASLTIEVEFWKSRMNVWKWCLRSSNRCGSWRCIVGKRHSNSESIRFESNIRSDLRVHMFTGCMHYRREVIQTARYIMCNCLDGILSHTYISVAFLMTYGTMWSLDMPFDAGFFAICFVILSYTRQSSITSFNYAVRDIVNYMAAEKRIRVG